MARPMAASRAWIPVLATAAFTVVAAEQAKPPGGSRVAVVAIHDSHLFTLCPIFGRRVVASNVMSSDMKAEASVFYPPDGSQSIGLRSGDRLLRVSLPMPGSVISDAAPTTSPAVRDLERLAHDPDVQARVEQQFRALRKYIVVETPAEADVVFLIESRYVPMSASTTMLPPGPEANRPPSGGDAASRINRIFSDTENEWRRRMWLDRNDAPAPAPAQPARSEQGGFLTLAVIGGDRFATWRQSAIAIAVPADVYRQHAGDGAALSSARIWQGLSGAGGAMPRREDIPARPGERRSATTPVRSASPEELVDQFHGKGAQTPADLPVCAATTGAILDVGDRASRAAASVLAGAPQPEPTAEAMAAAATGAARFRTNITLVTVPVTVTDGDGRRVTDVPASAFRIFEDGVEQKVDRIESGSSPTRVALLIDTSSGMRAVIDGIRKAARSLTDALRPADQAMVVSFDGRIQVQSEFTLDRGATERAIGQLRQRGRTRLYDALALSVVDRMSPLDGRKAIVLFTDGVDTGSQLTDAAGVLAAIDTANVGVYVVRYDTSDAPGYFAWASKSGTGQRPMVELAETQSDGQARSAADRFLERLAVSTGGRIYPARPDADPRALVEQVSQDLSHQYALRYYPSNATLDGTYREIRVIVDRPGTSVRARTGYRAGAFQADRASAAGRR